MYFYRCVMDVVVKQEFCALTVVAGEELDVHIVVAQDKAAWRDGIVTGVRVARKGIYVLIVQERKII